MAGRFKNARERFGKTYESNKAVYDTLEDKDPTRVVMLRGFLCVCYITVSLVCLTWTFKPSDGRCYVRRSFTPTSIDAFGGSGMYESTGIIAKPPVSRVEALADHGKVYRQRRSDVAAFPTMVSHATRDAAFLTVVAPLVPGAPGADGDASFIYGINEGPDTAFESDPGAEARLVGALTKLGFPGTGVRGGTVPNIARCAHGAGGADARARGPVYLETLLHDVAASTHGMASCLLSGQQRMVDVSSHHKASIVPFSSTNVMYMIMTVLWIASSFAVFSLQIATRHLPKEFEWRTVGANGLVLVCMAWNLGLVAISIVGAFDERIPVNNTLMSAAAAAVAIAIHGRKVDWAEVDMMQGPKAHPGDGEPSAPDMIPEQLRITNATHFGGGYARLRASAAAYTEDGLGIDAQSPYLGESILRGRAAKFAKGIEHEKARDDTLRFHEYAITTPLFFATLVAGTSPSATAPMVILAFGITAAFILACHATLAYTRLIAKSTVGDVYKTLLAPLLLAGTLALGAIGIGIVQYDSTSTAQASASVGSIFWVLVVTHGLLAAAVAGFVSVRAWAYEELLEMVDWYHPLVYSTINLVQKVVVSCMVIASLDRGEFPQQTCSLWINLQGDV